ncbi:hypothetical protein SDC9_137630 [bioreactor metagenome]|uniref:Uncharacterized protein n=1 Tax=bioreactor metagenome TaxID=1076179 RepID=A0A645DMI6_9ZZZZ
MLSIPMKERLIPSAPHSTPLAKLFPEMEAMMERPKTASKKNSGALNRRASFASCGEISHKASTLTTPPRKEETVEIPNARPLSPRLENSKPSSTVAAAAGVPGVLSRIAEMDPP